MSRKKLYLVSLGCTKNLVDSEVMIGTLEKYDITENQRDADVVIVNTCGFINSAKEESINTILTLHQERKEDSLLVVSGCLTERYKEELQRELPEVDIFTGVGDYEDIDRLIDKRKSRFSSNVYLSDENSPRVITGSNFHAYIKISEGCNQQCSFCAIPTFKGKLKSRIPLSIEKEVKSLVQKGFYEFTFISQDSSSYGKDLGLVDGLIELIDRIESIEGVRVARILYLYPSTTSFRLIDRIADSNIFQTYYDMPIQQIDDRILKIMRRGFGEEKTVKLLERMKSKGGFIRTSIIVGHPEEDEKAFRKVSNFLESFGFDRVNIFQYSNEENTSSYKMKPVENSIVEQRIDTLEKIVKKTTKKSLKSMVGKTVDAILEGESDQHKYLFSARPTLWAMEIDGDIIINDTNHLSLKFGKLYKVEITELVGDRLLGTLVQEI